MAPYSSTLDWKIPWMEEPGGLQSIGSRRLGHDWSDAAAAAAAAATYPFSRDFPDPRIEPGTLALQVYHKLLKTEDKCKTLKSSAMLKVPEQKSMIAFSAHGFFLLQLCFNQNEAITQEICIPFGFATNNSNIKVVSQYSLHLQGVLQHKGGSDSKRLPTTQETQVRSLGQEDPLEKEMATHSITLAWKIPWTEESGDLPNPGIEPGSPALLLLLLLNRFSRVRLCATPLQADALPSEPPGNSYIIALKYFYLQKLQADGFPYIAMPSQRTTSKTFNNQMAMPEPSVFYLPPVIGSLLSDSKSPSMQGTYQILLEAVFVESKHEMRAIHGVAESDTTEVT
ncbi:hypothetical protein MG293_000805 [Ovis ammon polii]|uniref:Uncharacterized protein n=1 Tax=Ovis ammon polii TaxID=230172 RepID=A0AAD4UQD0_OVIAM|nr:hypothetical protein MG293_000805 [Ovis ammon polii]